LIEERSERLFSEFYPLLKDTDPGQPDTDMRILYKFLAKIPENLEALRKGFQAQYGVGNSELISVDDIDDLGRMSLVEPESPTYSIV